MTVASFSVNTTGKSSGKLLDHISPFEKLLTLSSYCPCDKTLLDMYQQVATHRKLDLKLSQITHIYQSKLCFNKLWTFNNTNIVSLGRLLMLLKFNVITINLIPKLSLISKCC